MLAPAINSASEVALRLKDEPYDVKRIGGSLPRGLFFPVLAPTEICRSLEEALRRRSRSVPVLPLGCQLERGLAEVHRTTGGRAKSVQDSKRSQPLAPAILPRRRMVPFFCSTRAPWFRWTQVFRHTALSAPTWVPMVPVAYHAPVNVPVVGGLCCPAFQKDFCSQYQPFHSLRPVG